MFDFEFSAADDGELVAAIGEGARAEAVGAHAGWRRSLSWCAAASRRTTNVRCGHSTRGIRRPPRWPAQ